MWVSSAGVLLCLAVSTWVLWWEGQVPPSVQGAARESKRLFRRARSIQSTLGLKAKLKIVMCVDNTQLVRLEVD